MMDKLNVLIIGSGGREHAISQAVRKSPRLNSIAIAPGNAGMQDISVDIAVDDFPTIIEFCKANKIDLVIVGPELPLVKGLADVLTAEGITCFGPTASAAMLEGSKSFARDFAARYNIPGPISSSFSNSSQAITWLKEFNRPVVVKADGLASGKGVFLPESLAEAEQIIINLLDDKALGASASTILLEEKLEGEEVSLFGLADGDGLAVLSTAQDYKRVGEFDTGPNTGGMGAFSPVPGLKAMEPELIEKFLLPVVAGMAKEGSPYRGVIYAGLMLTQDGPKLIEYNCRFGDPEAEAIIPLINSDFLDLLYATATGNLSTVTPLIDSSKTCACVVVAANGYPNNPILGQPVRMPPQEDLQDVQIYHSGTAINNGKLVNTGGRVLTVSSVGPSLEVALDSVYKVVNKITGQGFFARPDIGHRYYQRTTGSSSYEQAGVSIDAGMEVTERIKQSVAETQDNKVVASLGNFGGVFDVSKVSGYVEPLLVASTDGVGTKTIIASQFNSWQGIGQDIVNHCVNDVLVQGAKPLFFLDTIASETLNVETVGQIVDGMASACIENSCSILGGETAEMKDVLARGAVDVSGTIIGVVEKSRLLPRSSINPGHLLLGMASSGLHTNGYSLARKILGDTNLSQALPDGRGISIGDAILAPHRSYLKSLELALENDVIDGMAHITGGGLIDNIPRALPEGCGAVVDSNTWKWPPIFSYLVEQGNVPIEEAYRVFNLGVGMVLIVHPSKLDQAQELIQEKVKVIGEVVSGNGVKIIGG